MAGSTRAALSSTLIEVNTGKLRRSICPSASNIESVVLAGMCVKNLVWSVPCAICDHDRRARGYGISMINNQGESLNIIYVQLR